MEIYKRLFFLAIVGVGTTVSLGNLYVWQSPLIGFTANAAIILACGWWLGHSWFPEDNIQNQTGLGVLFILITIAVTGGSIYSFWGLSDVTRIVLATFVPPATALLGHHFYKHPPIIKPAALSISRFRAWPWLLAVFFLSGWLIYIFLQNQTGEAVRSPWDILPADVFIIYFALQFVTLVWLLRRPETERAAMLAVTGLLLATELAVGLIVYKNGYGFDSYIHQATENLILQQGLVEPRQWYYLGQYGLVVILSTISFLPVAVIDRWLLPLLLVIAWPLLTRYIDRENKNLAAATLLVLASLPLTSFIQTTPQGLANLLFIACVFVIFFSSAWTIRPILGSSALALAASVFHPLAGIPAICLVGLKTIYEKYGSLASGLATLVSAVIIPAIFLIEEAKLSANFSMVANFSWWQNLLPYFSNRFQPHLDITYLFGFNLGWIIMGLAGAGVYMRYRKGDVSKYLPFFLLFACLIIDAVILYQFVPFNYLIYYERGNFSARLITLALYTLLPFVAVAVWRGLQKIKESPTSIAFVALLILASLRTSGFYLTYPRYDTYAFDRGYSTSDYDMEAVRQIEADAKDEPYVVLANQAVSAAALKELGFKKYFTSANGEQIFFYPIPTGGTLYQYYLDMVYEEPNRDTAVEAMKLTGVKRLYLVINDYWFDSTRIVEQAKQSSTHHWSIGENKINIFVYEQQ